MGIPPIYTGIFGTRRGPRCPLCHRAPIFRLTGYVEQEAWELVKNETLPCYALNVYKVREGAEKMQT